MASQLNTSFNNATDMTRIYEEIYEEAKADLQNTTECYVMPVDETPVPANNAPMNPDRSMELTVARCSV